MSKFCALIMPQVKLFLRHDVKVRPISGMHLNKGT